MLPTLLSVDPEEDKYLSEKWRNLLRVHEITDINSETYHVVLFVLGPYKMGIKKTRYRIKTKKLWVLFHEEMYYRPLNSLKTGLDFFFYCILCS